MACVLLGRVALHGSATRELKKGLVCARRPDGHCCYGCCGQEKLFIAGTHWGLLGELRLLVGFLLLCVHCACWKVVAVE